MVMLATLRRSGGIDVLARRAEVAPPTAALATATLLPVVLGGFRKIFERGATDGALSGVRFLEQVLARHGGGQLAMAIMADHPDVPLSNGGRLLLDMFGSDDMAECIARHGASEAGVTEQLMRDLLPMLAMLVAGYLAARIDTLRNAPEMLLAEMEHVLGLDHPVNPLDAVVAAG
ncbi:MAG TPA: DUF937 domain-containing protein [Novosphingobium sp.]|nr:DUF937 domain-containing protein [Novosphingobium sp.]